MAANQVVININSQRNIQIFMSSTIYVFKKINADETRAIKKLTIIKYEI